MVNGTCNRRRQNKANLPARPQTGVGQGSQQRSRRSGVLRQTNPIPQSRIGTVLWRDARRGLSAQGPLVQNEANSATAGRRPGNEMRKTNPIGRSESCETNPIRWAQICKTNPIPGGRDTHHSSIPLFQGSSPMPVAQNEPNCPKRGTEAVSGGAGWVEGCCTNKPNSCHYADQEIGVPGGQDPTLQGGQLRQTNPIQPPGGQTGSLGGENVRNEAIWSRLHSATGGMAPNKANFGRSGQESDAKCAKRTQFSPVGPSRWTWNPPPCAGRTRCVLCGLSAVAIGRQQR